MLYVSRVEEQTGKRTDTKILIDRVEMLYISRVEEQTGKRTDTKNIYRHSGNALCKQGGRTDGLKN